jgi:hypothetical protein
MVALDLLHPRWAGHSQASVTLLVRSLTATLPHQLKGLDLEQVALLVCTAHSRFPWPTAIAQLAAPISTTPSALQQVGNNHQFLPCLLTTKVSLTWYLEAKMAHLMASLRDLHKTIRVVATMYLARRHSILTTQWRGLICVAPSIPVRAL